MADKYTKVTTKSYGSRLMESLSWIVIWLLLFIASFFVLYWNEWRVDVSELAKDSTPIVSDAENLGDFDGKFISTSWILNSNDKIWDTYLKEWDFLLIERNVEIYAWNETSKTSTKKNLWWSETETTEYEYTKEWLINPQDSNSFQYPDWHKNYVKNIDNMNVKVEDLKIDKFYLNNDISFPAPKDYNPIEEEIILWENMFKDGKYIYLPYNIINENTNSGNLEKDLTTWTWVINSWTWIITTWTWNKIEEIENNFKWNSLSPEIWDIRISYMVLKNPTNNVTVFWQLDWNSKIVPYIWEKDTRVYRAFIWTRDEAIKELKLEHTISTWMFRLIWFLMMWFGLTNIFKIISVLLDVLPIFGSIASFSIGLVTFIVAFILSILTIIISIIFHNIYVLIITILIIVWLWYYFWKKKKEDPKIIESKV